MTKNEALNRAKYELSRGMNCTAADFDLGYDLIREPVDFTPKNSFKMASFGRNTVYSADRKMHDKIRGVIGESLGFWAFEQENLHRMDTALSKFGMYLNDTHMFYVRATNTAEPEKPDGVEIKWYEKNEIDRFKNEDWLGNTFAYNERIPDVLGVGAFVGGKLVAMAGASADSDTMWQIGIDTLVEYRHRGIGTYLVKMISAETERRDKMPFYGAVQSNVFSLNIASNCGYFAAWTEAHAIKGK